MQATPPAFICPLCQRPSWNPQDAVHRYCSVCGFVDEPIGKDGQPREPARDRGRNPWR